MTDVIMLENMTTVDLSITGTNTEALQYTCLECNFKTKVKTEMDNHVHNLHTSVEPEGINFVCGTCSHEFTKEDDFNVHVREHDQPKNSRASPDLLLDDTDDNVESENLEELVDRTSGSKVYKCTRCDFSFQEEPDLNSHYSLMHKDTENIRIVENDESTHDPVKHRIIADVEEPPKNVEQRIEPEVICPFCKLTSKNLDTLKVHIQNVHTLNGGISRDDSLEKISTQGNETFIKCPHCNYVVTAQLNLN